METSKFQSFAFYKAVINLMRFLSGWSLICMLVMLFVPFQYYNKWGFSVGMDFGKMHLLRSVNNEGENILNIRRASFKGSNLGVIKSSLIKGVDGNPYHIEYGSSSFSIQIPDSMANLLKFYIGIPCTIGALVVFYILGLIRRILYSVQYRTPFVLKNANDLNIIARLLCFAPLAFHIIDWMSEYYLETTFNIWFFNSLGLSLFDVACLSAGLVFALLAYVMKQGVVLKEEQELTI